jgi:CBS domain containing-hemolysin-like protein
MIDWPKLAAVPLLIALNAFFVIAEYALVAVRAAQVAKLREDGYRRAADAIDRLRGDMASALGAVQICITLTNLLIGWIGEPAMSRLLIVLLGPLATLLPQRLFEAISIAIAFIIVTLLTVVLSELVPKALTLQYTQLAARLVAPPMLRVQQAIRPLVWLMGALANLTTRSLGLGRVSIEDAGPTVDEIRLLAAEAGEQGTLTPRERSLILNALSLGRRSAEQIMIPRVKTAYLDLQRSMDENRRVMNEYLFSRMPLCDGGMDKVVGIIYTKEFLTAYEEHGEDSSVLLLIARAPVFVPSSLPLDRLLQEFHDHKTHLIFLADEHGTVEGIVTVTDVVDEIIGELADDDRVAPDAVIVPDGKGGWTAAGAAPIHDVARALGKPTWASQVGVNTLNGLLTAKLGRVPHPGEQLAVEGVKLKVLESDGRRVTRVAIGRKK